MDFLSASGDWAHFFYALLGLTGIVVTGESIRKYFGWPGETTRQIIHVATGILVFFSPVFLVSKIPAIVLGCFFTIVNFLAIRFEWLSGMHATQRKTYGTVYYPLSFTILAVVFWDQDKPAFMIAMAVLALGDAAAAIAGERVRQPHSFVWYRDRKSLEGSSVMFFTSLLVVLTAFYYLHAIGFYHGMFFEMIVIAVCTAVLATTVEAMSSQGSDNFNIPIVTAMVISFMTHAEPNAQWQFASSIVIAALVAVASYRLGFLTQGGSAGAFLLGTVIFGVGGWKWAWPILLFFVTSSILSKLGKKRKEHFEQVFEKGHTRDLGQVVANGGLAGLAVVMGYHNPEPRWYVIYLGAVAAVTSDTWGTEVGTFFKGTVRSIVNFKKVEPGTSGGISWQGTLGSLLGAAVIAGSGWAFYDDCFFSQKQIFAWIVLAGMFGSLVDSWLGATLQVQYICRVCNKITEKFNHCNENTCPTRGFEFLTNDRVNILCGFIGGLAAFWMVN
ncbi:DUF92 domain-containing protein [bacterium]|nr:DUF92 domain-containing protein [bacterium]